MRGRLQSAIEKLDLIKREIVATKEGGAITGEERIREHLDTVYGALNGWEGRPASYQIARVESLRRELGDVAKEFDGLVRGDLRAANEELGKRHLPAIPLETSGQP